LLCAKPALTSDSVPHPATYCVGSFISVSPFSERLQSRFAALRGNNVHCLVELSRYAAGLLSLR
jgi:hypothetical protein